MKSFTKLFAFTLLLSVGFWSCKKDEPKPTQTPTKPSVETYYFSATIDGKPVKLEHNKSNYLNGAGATSNGNGTATWVGQSSVFANAFDTKLPQAGFEIVKYFDEKPTACGQIMSMFEPRSYNFGSDVHSNPSEGVVIFYSDYKGDIWSSDKGLADQTGSSFKITDHTPNANSAIEFTEYTTKAEFNCTLYDDKGNSIKLTNGKVWGQTVQCQTL